MDEVAPSFTSSATFTVNEEQTVVGNVTTDDASATLTLGGTDAGLFTLAGSALSFKNAPDFETKESYSINVTAKDSSNNTRIQNITVNLSDINDNAPLFNSSASVSVYENQTSALTLSASDADVGDTLNYSISGGDSADFNINTESGVITFIVAPDYEIEEQRSYTFMARVSDGGTPVEQAVTITVLNINDTSENLSFTSSATVTVLENQSIAIDIDAEDSNAATLTYSLIGGADQLAFEIDAGSGLVSFLSLPNFEDKTQYSLIVRVDDGVGHQMEQSISINIEDVNEFAPLFIGSYTVSVDENLENAITLNAFDDDSSDNVTFSLKVGADADLMNILENVVKFDTPADYENKQSYSFSVIATDGLHEVEQAVVININNIAESVPTLGITPTLSVDEDASTDTLLGMVVISDAGDSAIASYRLSGEGSENFSVNADAEVRVSIGSTLDYETAVSYALDVYASNEAGESLSAELSINVNNIADATATLADLNATLFEHAATGDLFASVTVLESGDSSIISMELNGSGSDYFEISIDGDISVSDQAELDYETFPVIFLSVHAINSAGSSNYADIVIVLIDENDAPTATTDTYSVDEDDHFTSVLLGEDPESDSLVFEIVAYPSKGRISSFATDGSFRYNTINNENGYDEFTYRVSDGALWSEEKRVKIDIIPVNDGPVLEYIELNYIESSSDRDVRVSFFPVDDNTHKFSIKCTVYGIPEGFVFEQSDLDSHKCSDIDLKILADTAGEFRIPFYAKDALGEFSNTVDMIINITPVDNAPYIAGGLDFNVDVNDSVNLLIDIEDSDTAIVNFSITSQDVDLNLSTRREGDKQFSVYGLLHDDAPAGKIYRYGVTIDDGVNSIEKVLSLRIQPVYNQNFYIKNAVSYDDAGTADLNDDRLFIYYSKDINESTVGSDFTKHFNLEGLASFNESMTIDYTPRYNRHTINLYGTDNTTRLKARETYVSFSDQVSIEDMFGLIPEAGVGYNKYSRQLYKSYDLLATGQTVSQRSKDDGEEENGLVAAFTNVTSSGAPSEKMLQDNRTKLIWQDSNLERDYKAKLNGRDNACSELNHGGYSDWRMPSPREVLSIVNYGSSTFHYSEFQEKQQDIFCTREVVTVSTALYGENTYEYPTHTMMVDFRTGELIKTNSSGVLRCVRN